MFNIIYDLRMIFIMYRVKYSNKVKFLSIKIKSSYSLNKKWKNVLVNIAINDNTLPNLSETNRDSLYTDLYRNLTAYNYIEAINDISNKYGFTDWLNYTIIDEKGNISFMKL